MAAKKDKKNRMDFVKLVLDKSGPDAFIEDPEKFKAELVNYFDHVIEKDLPMTISGMVLFMGFSSRQSFYDYKKKPKMKDICEKAHEIIVNHYEQKINTDQYPTGAIFALKNLGWKAEEESSQNITTQKLRIGYGPKSDDADAAE
jgi:hypothetical protein